MPTYKLRKRGTIQENRDRTDDIAYNGNTGGWRNYRSIWAEVTPLSAAERVASNQVYAGATHRVVFRWPGVEVTEEHRLEIDGRIYPILGVTDLGGEGRYLEAICSQRAEGQGKETFR